MFALFNLGVQEMIVLGGCFLVSVVPAVVLAVVLSSVLRRKRPIEPDDGVPGPTPLERAKGAAAVLTPEEREDLLRSLEPPQPPSPAGGAGTTP
jgi:hypothetical protein